MIRFIFLLTFTSVLSSSFGQTPGNLDSLLRLLDDQRKDTIQLKINRSIGEYYLNANSNKAISYFSKAKDLAEQLERKLDAASNLYSMGYCYLSDARYDLSLDNYFQAIRVYEQLNDRRRLANTFLAVISVYTENKNFRKANEYYDKAQTVIEDRQDSSQLCTLLAQKANILYAQGSYDSALSFLQKELLIADQINDEFTYISTLGNMGLMLKKQGKNQDALNYTLEALKRIRPLENVNDFYAQLYNNLGSIYLQTEEYNLAENSFDKSIEYANLLGAGSLILENYRQYAELFKAMGKHEQESTYLRKYYELKDSIFSVKKLNQLNELEADYQIEKKNAEILKKDVALREHKYQRNLFIVFSIGAILLLSTLFYFFRKIQLKKSQLEEKNVLIRNQNESLEKLNEVKDRLFSVISHDLRNPIVSLRSYLAVTDNPEISEERKAVFRKQLLQALATTGEMLDNLLTWAKIQILNKRPLLVPVQVKDCVRDTMWAVSSQAEQKGILLKDHVDNVTVVSDPDSLSIALRNLITNALKFSNEGQTVLIESRQSEKELELIISDQGIGMDASEQEQILQGSALSQPGTKGEKGSGLGLILVRDLLERTNATLTLSSRKGEGSRFSIHLPLLNEAKAPL